MRPYVEESQKGDGLIRPVIYCSLLVSACLIAVAGIDVAQEGTSAQRFAELLAVARLHAGASTFIDAETNVSDTRSVQRFLFRAADGALVSVAVDMDTADVLAISGRRHPQDTASQTLLGVPVAAARDNPTSSNRPAEDVKDDRGRGGDNGQGRGGDRGGDGQGGQGNGQGGGSGDGGGHK